MFHESINWGGVLQGYALKKLIEDKIPNAEVDIIDYRSSNNIVYKSKMKQALQYNPVEIIKKSFAVFQKKNRRLLNKKVIKRREAFELFRNSIDEYPIVWNDETFPGLGEKYDCLISGSDQVWNPNAAKPGYFLKNIDNSKCLKMSYAASIARDDLSKQEREAMLPLIEQFDCISVREKTAKEILDKALPKNKEVKEVLDPTMMITENQWEDIIGAENNCSGKYALAFFFSDSLKYRNQLKDYCNKNGMTLKYIPFASGKYIKNDEKGYGECLHDIGPIEFLKLFRGAQCVFTDSFHGTVFSILFKKPFCVFERDKNTKVSKNSRLYDLLEKFDLKSRLVDENNSFGNVINQRIDFSKVEEKMSDFRKESLSFIIDSLGRVNVKNHSHVREQIKNDCNGCGLCENICPRNAVSMRQDSEGYTYPVVDESKCIKCGLCLDECNSIKKNEVIDCFVGYNKNEEIKMQSSSGGVFYAIAKMVIESGGCVFGAAFTEKFDVKHIKVEHKEQLDSITKSKYVQSDASLVANDVLEELKKGRTVLFSGTPCQVAMVEKMAIKSGVKEKLLLIDFVCHGVPSPIIWESYLSNVLSPVGNIKAINFRDKTHKGWHNYCLYVTYDNNKSFYETHDLNSYMSGFLSNNNLRPSCYQCKFKGDRYYSDITLADAWKIDKDYSDMSDDKGTSLCLIRSQKGIEAIKRVSEELEYKKTDYDKWRKMNPTISLSSSCPTGRELFWRDFSSMEKKDFWNKQKKNITVTKRCKYYAKSLLNITGLDKFVRKHI